MSHLSSDPERFSPVRPRVLAAGAAMGLLLGLTTSGGIAAARITRGAFEVALFANALTTAVALVADFFTMRRVRAAFDARVSRRALLAAQVLGAVVGVVLVHLLLRREALGVVWWLSEQPAQFVNDAVAVFGFLALVWAVADGLDAKVLVLAFVGVTLYRVTAPMWHVDQAPGGFHSSVQEIVVAQFVGAALALGLFRTLLVRADR